jgi:hypothetical protein
MTKRPRRTKGAQNKSKLRSVTNPGECISVDQLESNTQGFITQLKGTLTKKRYGAATVFVDNASRLSYIHLQGQISSDETVQAKRAFEAYAQLHGVTVKHYHADNGWMLCRQCISQVNCRIRTNNKFLWHQRSVPEWNRRRANSQSIQASKETTPTCKGKMAISNQNKSLAICTTQCK